MPQLEQNEAIGRLSASMESVHFLATVGFFVSAIAALVTVRNATVLTRVERHGEAVNGRLSQVETDHAQTRGAQDSLDKIMRYAVLPMLGIGATLAAGALGLMIKGGL